MNNFKNWLKFNENVEANWQDWLDTLFKYAKPNENQTIVLAKLGLQAGNKNKNIIEQVLKEKNLENFNWFSFCLGHLARSYNKMYRKEDLELAIDVTKKRIDNGDLPKSEIGGKGWLTIGFESIENVEKYIADSQRISKRQERKLRKKGDTLAEDEDLIKLIAQEGPYKLYLAPRIKYEKQSAHPLYADFETSEAIEPSKEKIEARKRVLCKYGKGTKWCTAIPDGTYHEYYLHNNIYIVHENNEPLYQFIDCNDDGDNHQFMDDEDRPVNELYSGVFAFLEKYASNSIKCYDQKVMFVSHNPIGSTGLDFLDPNVSDSLKSKISGRSLANILNELVGLGLDRKTHPEKLNKIENILNRINLEFISKDAYVLVSNLSPILLKSKIIFKLIQDSIKSITDYYLSKLISNSIKGETRMSSSDLLKLIGKERLKNLRSTYIFNIIQESPNLKKTIEDLGPEIVNKIKEEPELIVNWLIYANDIKDVMESLGDEILSYLSIDEISRILINDHSVFKKSIETTEYFINKFKNLGKSFSHGAISKMFLTSQYLFGGKKLSQTEYIFKLIKLFGKENISELYHDTIKYMFKIVGEVQGEEGKIKLAKLLREYYMRPEGTNTFVWSDYAKTENLLNQYS